MHYVFLHRAEYPYEHIEEVDADIGGYAARLADLALPAIAVPVATRGKVGKVYIIELVVLFIVYLFLQGYDRWVQAQLQYVEYFVACFFFYFLQGFQVPGIEDKWLFADGISIAAERKAYVGVVQVIGCADAHIVYLIAPSFQLVYMPIEALELCEKMGLRKIAIHYAHAVEAVHSCQQVVLSISYGRKVPRGNISGSAYQCEVFHVPLLFL